MSNTNNFTPSAAGTKTVSATTANQSISLNPADVGCQALMITNVGAGTIFFTMTVGAATTAIATGCPVLAGVAQVFTKGVADTVNIICSATATVYITAGEGQ